MSSSPDQNRPPATSARRKRPRPLPHVNARNLAIEKKRREQMNGNFLDLAYLVPSLAHAQRLTKVHIVSQTIEHLREQRDLCAAAARDMQDLLADNYRLAAEVSVLRGGVRGAAPGETPRVRSPPATMERLLQVSCLGLGTATLRDANEGPEPRAKVVSEAGAGMGAKGQQAVGLTSPDSSLAGAQPYLDTWSTGYDFANTAEIPPTQIWPQVPPIPQEAASLPETSLPTPTSDMLQNLPTDFSDISSNPNLYNISLEYDTLANLWPGIGTC